MRYIEKDLGPCEYAYIIPIADLHIGDPLFDEKKFLRFRDWICQTPNTYCILLGDVLNCATKGSVSDIYGEKMNPQEAKKYAVKLLEPIKERILGMVFGNHEKRIWKDSGSDVTEDLSMLLNVPYGAEGMLLNVKLGEHHNKGRLNYIIYATHGTGAGRTPGAKTNTLKRTSEIVLADIYVIAHVHFAETFADYYFVPDVRHKKIDRIKRQYVSVGSFLNWGGYSEEQMLTPTKTGTAKIMLSGKRKDFHASI